MALPLYELIIDESEDSPLAVFAVGLVDNPAIQKNWMAFSEESVKEFPILVFNKENRILDKEKRILAGPLMVAGQRIPRKIGGVVCEVFFSAETIEKIVTKYFKLGHHTSFNINHNDRQPAGDCYMFQSFIINSEMGINTPKGFDPLPDGTWFGFVKIENEEVWEDYVKTGKIRGFSVEGYFDQTLSNNFNMSNDKKSAIKSALESLNKILFDDQPPAPPAPPVPPIQMGSKKLADGTEITYEGELSQGTAVMIGGQTAPDGEYTMEDGTMMTVAGGVVASMGMPQDTMVSKEEMQAEVTKAVEAATAEFKTQMDAQKKANESALEQFKKTTTETLREVFSALKILAEIENNEPASNTDDPKKKAIQANFSRQKTLRDIIGKINITQP